MAQPDLFLFVSHVSEDRAAAMEIVSELERRGVRCWIAPRDVRPGQPFDDEIVDAIEASRALLLLFSNACNESEYIRREVTVAGESQKLIIPFRIEDAHPRRGLRIRLSDLHWIDGFVSRERAIDELVRVSNPAYNDKREKEKLPPLAAHELAPKANRPRIIVFGIGGAGANAINSMIRSNLSGCEFIVANTDAEALQLSPAPRKIQLGIGVTRGRGSGARPDVGRAAAEEAIDDILDSIRGSDMVFITAGMGGGTGTGATPVIARVARENGILTVGVVSKPFHFEGTHRMYVADSGLRELERSIDTLIVIPNQNLFRIADERTTFADAFKMADDFLCAGVRAVTDLLVVPWLVKLEFADIRTLMSKMGKGLLGTGEAEGERRAIDAAEAAINTPLLEEMSMKRARAALINVTGGTDMTLFEVDEAVNRVREDVNSDANVIFGSTFDGKLAGRMRVSVIATGIEAGPWAR